MATESSFIQRAAPNGRSACARFILLASLTAAFAHAAALDQLFAERRYLELEAALDASAQLSPAEENYFRGLLANRHNAPADSIAKLESVLPGMEKAKDSSRLKTAYYVLADDYAKTFRYAETARIYRKIEERFAATLPAAERRDVRDSLRKWQALSKAEPQTVSIDRPFTIALTRDRAGILTVPVTFRDQVVPCIFDTGANYSVLIASLAKDLGVAVSETAIPVNAITGGEVPARLGVMPEFHLGDATIRHAVFLVFDDRDLYIASLQHQIRGIIGFPVIAALGRLTFHKGEIEIGAGTQESRAPGEQNLYLEQRTPLVAASIDGQRMLFGLDSGATKSVLFEPFYRVHRADFSGSPEALSSTGAGGSRAVPAFHRDALDIRFGNATASLEHVPVYTQKLGTDHDYFYGNIGQDVLQQFERYTLDFVNMRLEFE